MEIPVEYDSEISGKLLRDIGWPKGSFIIGLCRGPEELIPKVETKIMPGDYLLIITPKSDKHTVKQEVRHYAKDLIKMHRKALMETRWDETGNNQPSLTDPAGCVTFGVLAFCIFIV